MNTETAGKVAGTVVDALRMQPALLVLVLLVGFFFTGLYMADSSRSVQRTETFKMMIDRCIPMANAGTLQRG